MARLGTTSVSALISGARAQRSQQQAYDDAMQLYQFNLSAKTQSDYDAYTSYLKGRQSNETDPMKLLTLQKAITSAESGFTSKEIQRSSLDILTGNATEQDKLGKIGELYTKAVGIGDDNLAQSLLSQYYTQQLKIDNQAQVASNKAQAASDKATGQAQTSNYKALTGAVQDQKDRQSLASALVKQGRMTTSEYNATMAHTTQLIGDIYTKAAQGAFGDLSEANVAQVQKDINSWQTDGNTLKYADPNSARAADNTGQYISFNPNDHTATVTNAGRTPTGVDKKTGLNTYEDFTTAGGQFVHPANLYNADGSVAGKTETGQNIQKDPVTGQSYYIEQRQGSPRFGQKIWLTPGAEKGALMPSVAPNNLPKIEEAGTSYNPLTNAENIGSTLHDLSGEVKGLPGAIGHSISTVDKFLNPGAHLLESSLGHGIGAILGTVGAASRTRAAAAAQALAQAQLQATQQRQAAMQPLPANVNQLAARAINNPAARSVLVAPTTPIYNNPTPVQQTANVTNSLNQLFPQYGGVAPHPAAPSVAPKTSGFSLLHPSTWF